MRGTATLTFRDEKVKNLLSPAVNKGNLRRLNYNKTVFSLGSTLDATRRAHDALPDPRVGRRGEYFLSIILPSRIMTRGRLVLILNW